MKSVRKANIVIAIAFSVLAICALIYVVYCMFKKGEFGIIGMYRFFPWPVIPIPVMLTVCSLVGWALVTLGEVRGDGELRCRKCSHILRGLSQPRCPECGEPI